uniref:Short-chain alcohol dehydrogenase n=1 Tax=uncultured organism TaxID=155900 RepID=A0A090A1B8_9ZZZZ|nr:short-chain alcohol dehydrogenase [uncultured organism]
MAQYDVADRSAIVTGGASGIGAAIAERLAAEGWRVVVSDLKRSAAEETAARIGGGACAFAADVADESQVAALVDFAVRECGRLGAMVNNAGIGEDPSPIDEMKAEHWNRIIGVNLTGAFFGTKHAARVMKAAGRGGVIVNMASVLGLVGFKAAPAYTAAKHGLIGFTKAAALELAAAGIRVVAVSPAFIRTPLIAGLEEQVLPLHPIGRLGEPREVASLVAYLVSEEAGFLTGATYLVDGGYTAQ